MSLSSVSRPPLAGSPHPQSIERCSRQSQPLASLFGGAFIPSDNMWCYPQISQMDADAYVRVDLTTKFTEAQRRTWSGVNLPCFPAGIRANFRRYEEMRGSE